MIVWVREHVEMNMWLWSACTCGNQYVVMGTLEEWKWECAYMWKWICGYGNMWVRICLSSMWGCKDCVWKWEDVRKTVWPREDVVRTMCEHERMEGRCANMGFMWGGLCVSMGLCEEDYVLARLYVKRIVCKRGRYVGRTVCEHGSMWGWLRASKRVCHTLI